nr:hypothetical protein [Tanacetum cinerariifolium]
MHDSEETAGIQEDFDSDLQSMPDDDLRSVSEFEVVDSDDTHDNEVSQSDHISQDDNAFAERPSLPDHMDHIYVEVSSLLSKFVDMESSIVQQVSAEIKSSLPALVTNALKEQLPEELPQVETQVQKNLQDQLPDLILKPIYKEFNTFNKLESQRFVLLQKTLNKFFHNKMRKSIRLRVHTRMKEVRNKLSACTSTVATNSQHVQDLRIMFHDMVSLLEATEGELSVAKENTETTMVTHKSKEKKSKGPEEQQTSIQEFTDQLFGTTSSKFSLTPPREPTPPRDFAKGKEVTIVEEQVNELVPYQEEEGKEGQDDGRIQSSDLLQADPLPITKISYVVNPNKEATMKITRGDNPLNLIVHPNFRLRTLGFSEWLKVHALASKKTVKSNDMLLQSLRAKFQWVITYSKKLGLPPPPTLATFEMTAEDKKRKRIEFLKEVFVTENISVDGMHRNPILPLGSCQLRALSSTNLMDSEVMKGLSECKASESNFRRIRVKDIVKEVEDYLKTYSSAGMDISWRETQYLLKARQKVI